MELIKEALNKAKAAGEPLAQREHHERPLGPRSGVGAPPPMQPGARPPGGASPPSVWAPPRAELDRAFLHRHRVVSAGGDDPSHVAFNLLRTRVYREFRDKGWRSLAITSPTAGCGKTMVAVNLALSLARQPDCRTVLLDLDLRRSAVAKTLGIDTRGSLGDVLAGEGDLRDCFVTVGDGLAVGCNHRSLRNSGDLLGEPRLVDLLRQVDRLLQPQMMILDLPPMLVSDDAIAIVPHVDATLMIAAAGETTAPQIEECVRHLEGRNFLGVILNKSRDASRNYYYDYGYSR